MDKNKDVGQARMLLAFDGPRLRFAYAPPPRENNERLEAMDRNQKARKEKAAKQQAERDARESAFRELEGGTEGNPFYENEGRR